MTKTTDENIQTPMTEDTRDLHDMLDEAQDSQTQK